MEVRPERLEDREAIAAVNRRAFGGGHEARLVEAIRASDGFVPGLSLVAEVEGAVVGHVMLSRVTVKSPEGEHAILRLAPIAVAPGHQRRGIGGALVLAAVEAARARGERLIVVLGHPACYPRFGFWPASALALEHPYPVPDEAFMALPLGDDAPSGWVRYPPAFETVA